MYLLSRVPITYNTCHHATVEQQCPIVSADNIGCMGTSLTLKTVGWYCNLHIKLVAITIKTPKDTPAMTSCHLWLSVGCSAVVLYQLDLGNSGLVISL